MIFFSHIPIWELEIAYPWYPAVAREHDIPPVAYGSLGRLRKVLARSTTHLFCLTSTPPILKLNTHTTPGINCFRSPQQSH